MDTCRSGRTVAQAVTVIGAVAALLVASAGPAGAHAALLSSQPEPGAELSSTPAVVRVAFTEPLITQLSTLRVTDPLGDVWERSSVGERSMSARLDTTASGVYRVEWKTVSPIDGHTLRGSFQFGVGVAVGHTEASAGEPSRADLVVGIARGVEYGALLLAVGVLVVARLGGSDRSGSRTRLRVATVTAMVAGAAVIVGEAALAADAPTPGAIADYVAAPPGRPRVVRLVGEAIAGVAAFSPRGRWLAAGGIVIALGALAAAGHAAATTPWWWGVAVATVHLVAAGVWAGGIAAMALARPAGGWRSDEGRALVAAFSPVAVPAFAVTVVSGSVRASQELVGWRDLWTTTYGRLLGAKLVAVTLMVPLSWRAWRQRAARPGREALLAIVAVAAASALASFPVPPQRAAEDVAAAEDQDLSAGLPRDGDVVLADTAGQTVVGLTLRPGKAGPNDVLVYLLPIDGAEAAVGVGATLSVDRGDSDPMEVCGPACRRATVELAGGETLRVEVEGHDTAATFRVPELPVPAAQRLLRRMSTTMDALRSLRYDEVFRPTDPPLRSTAALVAPDRLRFHVKTTGADTIRIDDTIYRRTNDGAWERSDGPSVEVPTYIWEYPDKLGAHIVATETVAGVATDVVTFMVEVSASPVWYRLWIDDDGLVRKAQMRTQGHFMDHRYYDFDADIEIKPPVNAS